MPTGGNAENDVIQKEVGGGVNENANAAIILQQMKRQN